MNLYLKISKFISNRINDFRTKNKIDFNQIINENIGNFNVSAIVLEVGCNDRPIINKNVYQKIVLHGIDPDRKINKEKLLKNNILDKFEFDTLESYNIECKYDIIILNTVFEHLKDNTKTLKILKRMLNKDGFILTYQPSNLHPFSLLNSLIPQNIKLLLLKYLRPWAIQNEETGWKAYYDKCNIYSLRRASNKENLAIKNYGYDFNASDYFTFFLPLFLLVVIYEEIIRFLNIGILCSSFWVRIEHK